MLSIIIFHSHLSYMVEPIFVAEQKMVPLIGTLLTVHSSQDIIQDNKTVKTNRFETKNVMYLCSSIPEEAAMVAGFPITSGSNRRRTCGGPSRTFSCGRTRASAGSRNRHRVRHGVLSASLISCTPTSLKVDSFALFRNLIYFSSPDQTAPLSTSRIFSQKVQNRKK